MTEGNFGKSDVILIILYIIVLAIVVLTFSDVFLLGITLLIILVITFVQKIYVEDEFLKQKKRRQRFVLLISEKIDTISNSIEKVGSDFKKATEEVGDRFNNRIDNFQREVQGESEKQYRDLARKILESENKINEVKKNLGIAYGSLDERLRGIEEREEI